MQYRFLCCSDTHGATPPAVDETEAVAWLHGGDANNGPTAVGDGSDPLDDPLRRDAARWFITRRLPVFVVRGNHDGVDDVRAFAGGTDLTGRLVEVAPRLYVAGIGWHGERYFELPFEADLRPVCEAVLRQARRLVMPRDRVVLLTHYPARYPEAREVPGDRDGAGVWYDCVRQVVEELRPLVVVQGHVHRWARTAFTAPVGDRQVLALFPGPSGAVVTVDIEAGTAEHEWAE
jgi:Icc-related predicted phosphoesterase